MLIWVSSSEGFFDKVLVSCHLLNFSIQSLKNSSLFSSLFSIDSISLENPTDSRPFINSLSILPSFQSTKSGSYFINYCTLSFILLKNSEPSSYSKGLVLIPEKFKEAIFILDFYMCCFSRISRFSIKSSKFPEKKKTSMKPFNF